MLHKRLLPAPPDQECGAPAAAVAEAAARYWWRRAAAQGSGEGLLRLGDSEYARGNMTSARRLYEQVGHEKDPFHGFRKRFPYADSSRFCRGIVTESVAV
jgi:hypothetical protein